MRRRALHRLPLALLAVVQPGGEHFHRAVLVAVLRAVVLALDHDAGGQVRQAHGGVGGVDRLAAGTAGAEDVRADLVLVDLERSLDQVPRHGRRFSHLATARKGATERHLVCVLEVASYRQSTRQPGYAQP